MRLDARRPFAVVVTALAVLLAACGAGDDGAVGGDGPRAWRDLDVVVPDGWVVTIDRPDLLFIANEDIRVDDEDLDEPPSLPEDRNSNDVVGAQFIADGSVTADAWRELVEEEDGVIESDTQTTIGGLPATSITYTWESNDVPLREQVVFVPSRQLYVLLQPVALQGQTNGPEVFQRHTEEFASILDSIEFGRPVEE